MTHKTAKTITKQRKKRGGLEGDKTKAEVLRNKEDQNYKAKWLYETVTMTIENGI